MTDTNFFAGMSLAGVVAAIAAAMFVLAFLSGMFFTVDQQQAGVVERFSKFHRTVGAGLHMKLPLIESVDEISLQVQQLPVSVETKTKDNVFVELMVSVQYFVMPTKVLEAYYTLEDPEKQLSSYVFDVVRAKVPRLNLDDLFERKDEIADAVKAELTAVMDDFGYGIMKALVTDIDPAEDVKTAMNAINAAQRNREAAKHAGEANRILLVANAEAEAASKKLQGEGIANQRKAIVDGLRESVRQFEDGVPGVDAQAAMNMVVLTQYFDTLQAMAATGKLTTVLLPHSPAAAGDLAAQIRESFLVANAARSEMPAASVKKG